MYTTLPLFCKVWYSAGLSSAGRRLWYPAGICSVRSDTPQDLCCSVSGPTAKLGPRRITYLLYRSVAQLCTLPKAYMIWLESPLAKNFVVLRVTVSDPAEQLSNSKISEESNQIQIRALMRVDSWKKQRPKISCYCTLKVGINLLSCITSRWFDMSPLLIEIS